MEFYDGFLLKVSDCKEKTIREFPDYFSLLKEILTFYGNISIRLKELPEFDEQGTAVSFINIKLTKSSFAFLDLMKHGYYDEGRILLRNIYESIFLCQYLIKDKNAAAKYFKCERIPHSKVVRELSLPREMQEIYGQLCEHTHTNFSSVVECIAMDKIFHDESENRHTILLNPSFEKLLALDLMSFFLVLLLIAVIDYFEYFRKYDCLNLDSDFGKEFYELQVLSSGLLNQNNEMLNNMGENV